MKKFYSFIIAFLIIANACFAQSGWVLQSSGTTKWFFGVSFTDANNGTAVGNFGTILRTTNGGTNWTSQSSGTGIDLFSVSFTDENNGMAVGGYGVQKISFGIICRTTNGGTNWTSQFLMGLGPFHSVSLTDTNWTAVGGNLDGTVGIILRNWVPQFVNGPLFGVSFTDENNGTAVGVSGIIIRTTNGGTNWTSQSSGTTNDLIGVSFTDSDNGTAVGYSGTILGTTNGGTNWISQSSGTTNNLRSVSFTDSDNGTAVGDSGTILRTTNGGINWTSQSSGTTNYLFGVSFTDSNNGTIVGANGTILRTTNGGVFVNQISSEIPESFVLFQNYPNPFNPVTKIKFDVPSNVKRQMSNVKLVVFNILGKEVATLVNERLSAGSYEVEFDGRNLSSGIYFYRLESESFIQTKSMVLLK